MVFSPGDKEEINKFVGGIVNQRVNLLNMKLPTINIAPVVPIITPIAGQLAMNESYIQGVNGLIDSSNFYFVPIAKAFNKINQVK